MHFKGRLSAPSLKVLLFSPLSSCLRRLRLLWQHQKTSHPCSRAPGSRASCCSVGERPDPCCPGARSCCHPAWLPWGGWVAKDRPWGSRHSFILGQSLLPAATGSAFLLFRPRTYLLSKHFRRSLPRFLI